ncbi:tetratricopeptide repeat protein [Mariniflexile sp.]|uniref:tetratricopeptide repeat protein n=1 Tax=Mariniflexile sp. TaxID=1979402 RepID=UPI00356B1638
MVKPRYTYQLLCYFMVFHVSFVLFATPVEQVKKIDSLLEASTKDVYENPDKSIKLGLSIYEDNNLALKLRIKGLMLVSLAYTSKRDYQKALEYVNEAYNLLSQLNDPVLKIEILSRSGILYQQLKIFDKSLDFLDRAEQLAMAYPYRDSVGALLGRNYLVKGFIYKDNLNCDIALSFFAKGIQEYERLGEHNYATNLSIAYYNKGNCYILFSEHEKAKASFRKSIALAKQDGANSLESFAKKGLAEVFTLEERYDEAIALLQEAMQQSSKVGDLILYRGIYEGLFENYLAINDLDNYQHYYDLYLKTQFDIEISERNSISASIDENIKLQNEKLYQLKNRFKYHWNIIILIAVVIIFGIVFNLIQSKKTFKKLQSKIDVLHKSKL